MSLLDHLHPDTEAADWRYQDFFVEIHRYDQREDSYEGTIRIKGSLMTMVGPDTRQKVAQELEKTLLAWRPELQEVLAPLRSKSALERILEEA